jgi:hypothetical protein
VADVPTTLKDAAYVTIGLGVLGFQKAQVRRVEVLKQLDEQRKLIETQLADATKAATEATKLATAQMTDATKLIEAQVAEATKTFRGLAQDLDVRMAPVRGRVEGRIDTLEGMLPEPVRDLFKQARVVARETQGQMRSALGLTSSTASAA